MSNKLTIIIIAIIITIVIITIGYVIKYKYFSINHETVYTLKTKPITATDGNTYNVHNFSDAGTAANILAYINKVLVQLIAHLKYKYIGVGYNKKLLLNNKYTNAVNNILMRYNPDNLIENSPVDKADTSYTLNKGSMIAFCLREKGNNNYIHDINTLIFVAIHELAHVAVDFDGHPTEFWAMFKWLLMEAEEGNIYISKDYSLLPVHYCGMDVDYNPKFDNSLQL
jgi:hypothetical protein